MSHDIVQIANKQLKTKCHSANTWQFTKSSPLFFCYSIISLVFGFSGKAEKLQGDELMIKEGSTRAEETAFKKLGFLKKDEVLI